MALPAHAAPTPERRACVREVAADDETIITKVLAERLGLVPMSSGEANDASTAHHQAQLHAPENRRPSRPTEPRSCGTRIDALVSDPLPDGKVKKKLKGADGVYRMRVTDHRVFYRFGEDWISLLGIRRRAEDTYDGVPDEAADVPRPTTATTRTSMHSSPRRSRRSSSSRRPRPRRTLPEPIAQELLRDLACPVAVPTLLRCTTEEALLEAPVPPDVLSRVVDRLFPPTIERLDQQPDLVVPSTRDLVRFKEGDLLGLPAAARRGPAQADAVGDEGSHDGSRRRGHGQEHRRPLPREGAPRAARRHGDRARACSPRTHARC